MSERTFKFKSPGIFTKEIDKTNLSNPADSLGPLVIGRFEKGPGNRAVLINSLEELKQTFGEPYSGAGTDDPWRMGNKDAPSYAAYAAKAYLRSNFPINIIRLLGEEADTADDTSSTGAEAGWVLKRTTRGTEVKLSNTTSGGGYGLFIANSGSDATHNLGTLAAVFYVTSGSIELTSSAAIGGATGSGASRPVADESGKYTIKVPIAGNKTKAVTFSFDSTSKDYIRSVFNTNPTLTNSAITHADSVQYYWLGETFEDSVEDRITDMDSSIGMLLGLKAEKSGSANPEQADFRMVNQEAATPWVVSQADNYGSDFSFEVNTQKLFRLVSINGGAWPSKNLKVSITDIRPPITAFDKYGTFTVVIREAFDKDYNPKIIERYSNCTLDQNSSNYIAKRIGDMRLVWDDTIKAYKSEGSYPNVSKYFWVDIDPAVEGGAGANKVPFGFYGPPRYKGFSIAQRTGGEVHTHTVTTYSDETAAFEDSYIAYTGSMYPTSSEFVSTHNANFDIRDEHGTFKFFAEFPAIRLRANSIDINPTKPENTFWGIVVDMKGSPNRYNYSYADLMAPSANGVGAASEYKSIPDSTLQEYSFYFTLDHVSRSSDTVGAAIEHYVYDSASIASEKSLTATNTLNAVIDKGIDRFTMPVIGGFDGLDVQEKDPFGTHVLNSSATELSSYAFHTVNRALDSIAEREDADIEILTVPGVVNTTITDRMIDIVERRQDCLAIIDLEGGYTPASDSTSEEKDRVGSVATTVTNLRARDLNSSYACSYYPWVKIRDRLDGSIAWVPPSVVALGAIGRSEASSELWFAPAGFTRGGLSLGASGLDVISARERLRAKDRDKLYENNVNPIATFPAEGVVIFGQKTLQATPSALDRINVRRLMIFLKRQITAMASDVLFDQNVQATWQRFLRKVEPFLGNVKTRFGLTDFLVVLDETTTTPDLVDRNIMYAKILVKPARAIEFIALDFVLTNTGAEFLA